MLVIIDIFIIDINLFYLMRFLCVYFLMKELL